jgi:pimeloyl-ACP methyl ester carboxylesterase
MSRSTADTKERVLRRLEWAFPPEPVELEIIERLPSSSQDKPPILFVHGLGHAAWSFDEHWMPWLAERGWPCYAVSLRGHGGSGRPEDHTGATLRHYEHDVMQAIVELPRQPVIVGHAASSLVVMRVLERYPARAGVLVAPVPADGGLGVAKRLVTRFPSDFARGLLARPLEWRKEHFFSERLDDQTALRYLERFRAPSVLNQYEMLLPRTPRPSKAPVFVIGTRDDAFVPARDTERTALAYNARLRMFVGMGHSMMLDAGWEEPVKAMEAWLERELS